MTVTIKVRPYLPNSGSVYTWLTVESDFDSKKEAAKPATWEQIYTDQLSSQHDVDYYRIEASEPAQVHLDITSNKVTIEDSQGNIHGIFVPSNREVFDLPAGTYYAKVEYRSDSQTLAGQSDIHAQNLNYQLAHKKSKVSYGQGINRNLDRGIHKLL